KAGAPRPYATSGRTYSRRRLPDQSWSTSQHSKSLQSTQRLAGPGLSDGHTYESLVPAYSD
ncbi:MAG: hypothetical protein K2J38_06700, partial [Muribaculaceae bacterium]|nr:hypothetical protein [Muribaculaceae bacterium]